MDEMKVLTIAQVCHGANRAWCQAHGDDSQLDWAQAPDWQRASAINGVKFHLGNPNSTPEQSHENWLEEKRKDGWTYGPVKDAANKVHPCFMPYSGLPLEQRMKDSLFIGIVRALEARDQA